MNKKKGFTLIELLAVIVILAIIALITIPLIMNVISNAKEGSAKDSAYGYLESIDTWYAKKLLEDSNFKFDRTYTVDSTGKLGNYNLGVKGTKPKGGSLTFTSGKVSSGCLTISDYKVTINNGEVTDVLKGSCDATTGSSFGGAIEYPANGETYKAIVYLDPEDLSNTCNATLARENVNENGSPTGIKDGCMKWYVFDDTGDYYTMILDHNITGKMAPYWASLNNLSGPSASEGYILSVLNSYTRGWSDVETLTTADNYTPSKTFSGTYTIDYSNYKARLISAEEIAIIVNQDVWDSNLSTFFDSSCNTVDKCSIGTNVYGWLFDNLGVLDECIDEWGCNCIQWGCNLGSNSDPEGYWTSSPSYTNNSYATYVFFSGMLSYDSVYGADYNGIRPVIKVLQSKFNH